MKKLICFGMAVVLMACTALADIQSQYQCYKEFSVRSTSKYPDVNVWSQKDQGQGYIVTQNGDIRTEYKLHQLENWDGWVYYNIVQKDTVKGKTTTTSYPAYGWACNDYFAIWHQGSLMHFTVRNV